MITNTFTKQVLLLSDRSTYTVTDWINVKRLNTKLLTSTTYYFQINDQSEYTNQIVKIVLYYFLISHSDEVFTTVLLYLQNYLNNFKIFMNYVSNEIVYEFWVNDTLDTLCPLNLALKNYSKLHQIYCEDAEHIIIFVNVMSKHYYNARHTLLIINEMIYLQLFHRYIISDLTNQKLSNQCIRFFQMIKCIDNLIYHLKVSSTMQIYLIVSIVQLESASHKFNLYNCYLYMNLFSIENKQNNNVKTLFFYEIKCLLDK